MEIRINNRKPLQYINWVLEVEYRIKNLIPYSPRQASIVFQHSDKWNSMPELVYWVVKNNIIYSSFICHFYWIQFHSLSELSVVSFLCYSLIEIINDIRMPLRYINWVVIMENRIEILIPYSPTTSKFCVSTFW